MKDNEIWEDISGGSFPESSESAGEDTGYIIYTGCLAVGGHAADFSLYSNLSGRGLLLVFPAGSGACRTSHAR